MIIFIDIIVSKVTARLERQRKVWDEKLEQMKDKARTQREESTALMLSTATSSSLGNKVSALTHVVLITALNLTVLHCTVRKRCHVQRMIPLTL